MPSLKASSVFSRRSTGPTSRRSSGRPSLPYRAEVLFNMLNSDPSWVDGNHPLVGGLSAAAGKAGIASGPAFMNASCDAWRYSEQLGIPAVVFGPGSISSAHGIQENVPSTRFAGPPWPSSILSAIGAGSNMTDKTMNALVKTAKGVGLIELREVPVPEIGDNEVLIEVKAAGICGTDLHICHDEFPYWPPVILGHEFAGVVGGSRHERPGLEARGPGRGRAAHPGLRQVLALPDRATASSAPTSARPAGASTAASPSTCAIPSRPCSTASPTPSPSRKPPRSSRRPTSSTTSSSAAGQGG